MRRSAAFSAPVHPGDFADPTVLVAGGSYWAYSTGSAGRNLQVMSSPDLRTWSDPADPLPVLPSWASPGRTWAPGVLELGGRFVMYYTVRHAAFGMQCVSVATAADPGGPFTDSSPGPLVCQTGDGGSIDPNPYPDPVSGSLVLLWKSDENSIGRRCRIWAQQLAPDGLSFVAGSSPSLLLTQSRPWQAPRVEGPTVTRHRSRYYLFYGANSYETASSGIGYATSSAMLGAFRNRSIIGPWLGSTGAARGPQGPMIFEDMAGRTRMAFAAWTQPVGYENGGVRCVWIASLDFDRLGRPRLG